MGVFGKFRETVAVDTVADPLMIEAAAETYRAVVAEAKASQARYEEILRRLQPDAVNRARVKLADMGDYEGSLALDRELEELRVEAAVRNRHQAVLDNRIRLASEHLNDLQRRKIELEQATAVAKLDEQTPKLLAVIDEMLASIEPYNGAMADSWGASQCNLVRTLIGLRDHVRSDDRGGWMSLAGYAHDMLAGEPDHEAIVAYNGIRQGRPAAHSGIFGR